MSTRRRRAGRVYGATHLGLNAMGTCSAAELTRLMRGDPECVQDLPGLSRDEIERALHALVRDGAALEVAKAGQPTRYRLRSPAPGFDAHWGRRRLLEVPQGGDDDGEDAGQ